MAKRRRLAGPFEDAAPDAPLETKAMPFGRPVQSRPAPIASVAAESAEIAALQEMAAEISRARAEGRFVQALPLEAVEVDHLVRDRIAADPEEMSGLIESIRANGQRIPIEVTDLGQGRFGLISGWRRLAALKALQQETGSFPRVLAMLRKPAAAADAYVAMVEENEIRAGLSYYERARIAAKAVEAGVFGSEREALQRLYANASRAKRSKIGSFVTLHRGLGEALRFPAAIPERLGLSLVKRLEEEPGFAARAAAALGQDTAEAEAAVLTRLIAPPKAEKPKAAEIAPGIRLTGKPAALRLDGPGVDAAFRARLEEWLRR
ncbi:ParB N-terminal domain-containing protein [Cereibacter sp. SYSU M97828]|nr:ParB N-terminal domain-containing protein [Cereibacter flavus]